MTHVTAAEWHAFLAGHPQAHLLQMSAWGEHKAGFGWDVARLVVGQVGAQVLFRQLPLGLSFAYLPKGPLGSGWDELWPELDALCRARGAIFLQVEPDVWEDDEFDVASTLPPDLQPSPRFIQPPRTLLVDLTGEEEDVLACMKQKTRYNIRLAARKDVTVHSSSDVDQFYAMMQVTGQRDAFGVHSLDYYQRAYDLFHPQGACELLIAEHDGQPLAGLMVFCHGQRAWYLYGASTNRQRNRMPTYLLQWEAMRWARSKGCSEYDLWGVPDADLETLEAQFTARADGLWGVYRNKRGFGGQLKRAAGSWDRVYRPFLYSLYLLYTKWRAA